MLKLIFVVASFSALAACSASAGAQSSVEQGTSACIDYLSAGRSTEAVDEQLQSSNWQEKNRRDSDDLFIRSFKKDDISLSYKRKNSDKMRSLIKESVNLPKEIVTCVVSTAVSTEEGAISVVYSSNNVAKLPEIGRGRYSGSVEGRPVSGLISYGPNGDGRFVVVAEFGPTK
jgi:hypothetical protein